MRDNEAWKRMVLRSMPKPAWLGEDAPQVDIVLSSRSRVMRNLRGRRFPAKAETPELLETMRQILSAAREAGLPLEAHKDLTNAERDYLVGCRLVSPEFEWTLPGRALLMDGSRTVSLMINEEDHLRLQAVTAGWSVANAEGVASHCLSSLEPRLEFARTDERGYLSASPFNCGHGRRQSGMFHLIGLAHGRRLPAVLRALASRGIAVRGLFGESSRAVGAFVQVSVTNGTREDFVGACEYLMREERDARREVTREALREKAVQARDFAIASPTIGLADALRVLAWARWAASAGLEGFAAGPRIVDAALTTLEIRGSRVEEVAGRERADSLRAVLEAT